MNIRILDDKIFKIIQIALITICIALLLTVIVIELDRNEACDMRFNETNHRGIEGVWYTSAGEEYMCVWLDHRTSSSVRNTIMHEQCHSLVYNNYDHFCGGSYDDS